MSFEGFPRSAQTYLQDLAANNTKEWFDANRTRYDEELVAPATALIEELAGPLSAFDPPIKAEAKVNKSIRRIFRDTRFSADKTPYHTHFHMIFWTGPKPNTGPGIHVVLGRDHFGYGAGHWAFGPDELKRFRDDVLDDGGKEVSAVVNALERKGLKLDEPQLARVPNGIDKALPGAEWTRYKGLVMRTSLDPYPKELFGAEGADYLLELCRDTLPLIQYLNRQVFNV